MVVGLESACPQACVEDENSDNERELPLCEGRAERNEDTCGNQVCDDFLHAIDDASFADAKLGLGTCTGNLVDYTELAGQEDYVKHYIQNIGEQCGLEVGFTPNPLDSCMGAVGVISRFDMDCPRQCEEGAASDSEMRPCANGEDEREASTCGSGNCKLLMIEVQEGMEDMKVGLASCDDDYAELKLYGPQLEGHAQAIAGGCGFNWNNLQGSPVTIVPSPAPVAVVGPAPSPSPSVGAPGPARTCHVMSAERMRQMRSVGY